MSSIYFNTDHEQFRKTVQEYITVNVLPYLSEWEANKCIPVQVWKHFGNADLLGLHYPKEYGGLEKDIFYSVILLEELGRTGCAGFRVAIAVHSYMATSYIARFGSDYLKKKYLAPAITGDKIAALALTESGAGSDLSEIKVEAKLLSDHYIINGTKKFIANGSVCDFLVVAVRTDERNKAKHGAAGISLMVVDANAPGITKEKIDCLGWHAADTCELTFVNVKVPVSNIIGQMNQAFYYLMQCLQLERLAAGVLALGTSDKCIQLTWKYISKRRVFNAALHEQQVIRHRMADLISEIEAVRQLAYHAAWLHDTGQSAIAESTMLKLKSTELANVVAQVCIQFHGAHGYQANTEIARIYRDAQAGRVAGGASEIMRNIIAQFVLDDLQ
jgi:acyl-CoA dehydrogenase